MYFIPREFGKEDEESLKNYCQKEYGVDVTKLNENNKSFFNFLNKNLNYYKINFIKVNSERFIVRYTYEVTFDKLKYFLIDENSKQNIIKKLNLKNNNMLKPELTHYFYFECEFYNFENNYKPDLKTLKLVDVDNKIFGNPHTILNIV